MGEVDFKGEGSRLFVDKWSVRCWYISGAKEEPGMGTVLEASSRCHRQRQMSSCGQAVLRAGPHAALQWSSVDWMDE